MCVFLYPRDAGYVRNVFPSPSNVVYPNICTWQAAGAGIFCGGRKSCHWTTSLSVALLLRSPFKRILNMEKLAAHQEKRQNKEMYLLPSLFSKTSGLTPWRLFLQDNFPLRYTRKKGCWNIFPFSAAHTNVFSCFSRKCGGNSNGSESDDCMYLMVLKVHQHGWVSVDGEGLPVENGAAQQTGRSLVVESSARTKRFLNGSLKPQCV